MQSMRPEGSARRATERARHLALILVVMLLPATTLYSQIVGHGTAWFSSVYLLVTVGCVLVGRVMDAPPVVPRAPAWDPPSLSGD